MRRRDRDARRSSAVRTNPIDYRTALAFWSFGIPAGVMPPQAGKLVRSDHPRPARLARETTKD